ncbi:hypothetical protein [Nocardia aurantiaca]|uniref:Uncharacterized protein n=1 Tax=Nocardia aurantiaca TaxID=2675850 RepID=A0A6I3KXW4_9NOCA|nr:hypothetical protein [Nocardia aurantiaca]MTE14912.1 hypothetical protein [Nocardia aurantiaca]
MSFSEDSAGSVQRAADFPRSWSPKKAGAQLLAESARLNTKIVSDTEYYL